MVLGMFGKCCSKSWKNPNILFRQLCKTVSRLRSGRHKPADNSRHAFFLSRFISLHQSVQSQGSSMLLKINDSHLLVNSTIVNVRNLSRQKVFSRSFFSLSEHGSVLRTKKWIISIGSVVFGIQIFYSSSILFPNCLTTFVEISNW